VRSVQIEGRIRWADADSAGRLYYPRVFDYVSEAEHDLMRSVGIWRDNGRRQYEFPRVHAECHFKKVLALDDRFVLRLSVARIGRTSIRYKFQAFLEAAPDAPAAFGSVTVVMTQNGVPIDIPDPLRAALSESQ
jgi:YbgC/YbaW family acyl-CoA thioester hydrolase